MQMRLDVHYWRIQLNHSEVYWASSINYSLSSVPREAVLDGHMLGAYLSSVVKIDKISKDQYNEFMVD